MITALAWATIVGANPTINDVLSTNFRSATFTARKVRGIQSELKKINDDFAQSYRFTSTAVSIKEPFKIRLEAKVEDTSIVFIVNGPNKVVRAPRSGINIKDNVAKDPGKRQTPLDFGFLTPALFEDLMDAKFVRNDRATGALVFDLTFKKRFNYSQRHRVWIEPKSRAMVMREWYAAGDGRLMATFLYAGHKIEGTTAFPTRYEVRNADNRVAGTMELRDLKINPTLSDDLFKVN
jgi:outer membrane lipoprotein-sorting protein